MPGCLHLTAETPRADRPAPFDDDVSYSESFVEAMLERFTQPGDVVVDPFVGFGTTIAVAERMGRVGYGVELLADRADFVRGRTAHPDRVVTGDAKRIGELGLPPASFSLSSPPYMTRLHHPEDPLTGYTAHGGSYDTYLAELTDIYRALAATMTSGARIAVNVANIRAPWGVTFLAWDVASRLSEHLELEEEITLCWDRPHPMISQDCCFVFRSAGGRTPRAGGVAAPP